MSVAPSVTAFDKALCSPILGATISQVSDGGWRNGNPYFSLKPPPTPAPFLFTETVASSKPHVAAMLREAVHTTTSKDSI